MPLVVGQGGCWDDFQSLSLYPQLLRVKPFPLHRLLSIFETIEQPFQQHKEKPLMFQNILLSGWDNLPAATEQETQVQIY